MPADPHTFPPGDTPNSEEESLEHESETRDSVDSVDSVTISVDQLLELLIHGEMEERGLLPYSSNYSFLVLIKHEEHEIPAVYKPRRGENPLWDFPTGTLCLRESAAYEVSAALGWDLVPPTVLRTGTRGLGSVQFFVHCDPDVHYFTMQADARYADAFRQLALFDYVVNNADRKSGHCLFGFDERMWAIDHGICFHHEYKLRTVVWEFSGAPIEVPLLNALEDLQASLTDAKSKLSSTLSERLHQRERTALCRRVETLLTTQRYPAPPIHQRNYPWPPI